METRPDSGQCPAPGCGAQPPSPQRAARFRFQVLAATLAAALLAWLFYFPYDRRLVCSAAPHDATIVTVHENLAGRWETIRASILLDIADLCTGLDLRQLLAASDDGELHAILRRFARRTTLFAVVNNPERDGQSCLIASWAGAQALLLRWQISLRLIRGCRTLKLADGRRAATWPVKLPDAEASFYLTVADGIVLGCLSTDPAQLELLVSRVARRSQSSPCLGNATMQTRPSLFPDRGWIFHQDRTRLPTFDTASAFELQTCGPARISGFVSWPASAPGLETDFDADSQPTEALIRLLPGQPLAFLFTNADFLARFARAPGLPAITSAVAHIFQLNSEPASQAFVALFPPSAAGSLMEAPLPAVVAGVRQRACVTNILENIPRQLAGAEFNSRFRCRLEDENGLLCAVIQATRASDALLLAGFGRPGFACRDGWLLAAGNVYALSKPTSNETTTTASRLISGPAVCRGYINFAAAEPTLKNLIAFARLAALLSSKGASDDAAARLQRLGESVPRLAALKDGVFRLRAEGNRLKLQFDLGGPPWSGPSRSKPPKPQS